VANPSHEPLTHPSRITLHHRLTLPPAAFSTSTTSITLACAVLSTTHHRPAARVTEEVLPYDYRAGQVATLPPWMVAVFRQAAAEEEAERACWAARRAELEGWVEELERGSWNRAGAVEDMGGSGGR
jgi:hypothetical protein